MDVSLYIYLPIYRHGEILEFMGSNMQVLDSIPEQIILLT